MGRAAAQFIVLIATVASLVSVGAALLPVTALTEWICRRRQLPLLWQIPIATAFMGTGLLMFGMISAMVRGASLNSALVLAGIMFFVLLAPLGMYWWSMQSDDWIVGTAMQYRSRRRRSAADKP